MSLEPNLTWWGNGRCFSPNNRIGAQFDFVLEWKLFLVLETIIDQNLFILDRQISRLLRFFSLEIRGLKQNKNQIRFLIMI